MTNTNRTTTLFTKIVMMAILPMVVLTTSTGCINQMAQLLYVIKGHQIPAKFQGLEGKRVAVICLSDASAYGPDTLTYTVAKHVSSKIANGLKDVDVIGQNKIENWLDQYGWDGDNVLALGEDVKADMVIVIEIGSYSIHEGATIFKGKADHSVTVYDIKKDGRTSFAQGPDLFSFPENGRPVIQTTERQFEAFFLSRLTEHISRLFVPYDKMDAFADDAMMN